MNKKLISAIIVIILGIVGIIILLLSQPKGPILICELPTKTSNYTETLEFYYRDTVIEKFYRMEVFTEDDSSKLDEEENKFKEVKENIKNDLNSYVKYYSKRSNNKLEITTYIYVPRANGFFDHFFESKELYHFMTPEMIKDSLEQENYSCTLKNE